LGTRGRARPGTRLISSIHLDPVEEERFNHHLQAKYRQIEAHEVRCERYRLEDAEIAVVAFGTAARIAKTAIDAARDRGLRVGLLRPITLWPFPEAALRSLTSEVKGILVTEMNVGQMREDVERIVAGRVPVRFYGRTGGVMPMPEELLTALLAEPDLKTEAIA
jgi:2-oxoglutarate ferredoxin oxidoreductase subunit alpha